MKTLPKIGDKVKFEVGQHIDGGGMKEGIVQEVITEISFIGKDIKVNWTTSDGRKTAALLNYDNLLD